MSEGFVEIYVAPLCAKFNLIAHKGANRYNTTFVLERCKDLYHVSGSILLLAFFV